MKVFLIFILALGVTLIVAYLLGWRNLGNAPPAVPQKLIAMQTGGVASQAGQAAIQPGGSPKADKICSDIVQSVQQSLPIDEELSWLEGYIAARNTDGVIPAVALEREPLRTQLLTVCAEFPAETLSQAAERVLNKLRHP